VASVSYRRCDRQRGLTARAAWPAMEVRSLLSSAGDYQRGSPQLAVAWVANSQLLEPILALPRAMAELRSTQFRRRSAAGAQTSIVAQVPSGVTTGNVVSLLRAGFRAMGSVSRCSIPAALPSTRLSLPTAPRQLRHARRPTFSTQQPTSCCWRLFQVEKARPPDTVVNSVAGGSLTWVLVQRTNTQSGTAEIWRAFAPTALTNVTVTQHSRNRFCHR